MSSALYRGEVLSVDGPVLRSRPVYLASLLAFMAGCGAATPAPPAAKVAEVPDTTARAAPAIDLSPVAEPPGIVLVAHARAPMDLLQTGFGWLGLAIPVDHLLPTFGPKPVPLDRRGGFDVIAVTEGGPTPVTRFAVSIPILSLAELKEALGDVVIWEPIENGALRAAARPGTTSPIASALTQEGRCAIAPSVGDAKARLVFAEGDTLSSVLPYLTRTVPLAPHAHNLSVELRPDFVLHPPATPYLDELRGALPGLPVSYSEGLSRDLASFVSGLHGGSFTLDVDARGTRIEARVPVTAGSSTLASVLLASTGPAPLPSFSRLPARAAFAFYGSGTPIGATEGVRSAAVAALAPKLDSQPLADALRATLELTASPWVAAVSLGAPPGVAKTAADDGMGVWVVAGLEERYERVAELARGWIVKGGHGLVVREGKAPKGSGKEAMRLELRSPAFAEGQSPKRKIEPVVHALFASDGPRTWVAISLEEKHATALLRELTSPLGPSRPPTFGDRAEARWLGASPSTTGAFLGLKPSFDPSVLQAILGPAAAGIQAPLPEPLLVQSEIAKRAGAADELVIRTSAGPGLSATLLLTYLNGMVSASATKP